jgi:hypothetical protein
MKITTCVLTFVFRRKVETFAGMRKKTRIEHHMERKAE